ncbi:MAG: SPOR domain-containing protein, partial [Candidatus Kapaibacterium sp.]
NGKITEVKSQLPDLMVEYPDDAGVKLLLAVVIDDAHKSLDIYKKIVANYPESDWADDAYWRIVQFYALKGETNKAQYELNYFKTKYPRSPYIVPAAEVVRMAEGIFRKENNILKATNEKPIGRENTPVVIEEPAYKPQPMQDLTSEEEPEKIGMVIEKERPAKPVVEPTQEEKPVQMKKVVATNQDNLAMNTSSHKVVRQRVKVEVQDINPNPSPVSSEILEDQKKRLSETEIAEARVEPVVEKKVVVQPTAIEIEEVGNTGYYGLQVGLFDDMKNANSEMKKFLRKRMRTEVKEKSINDKQQYAVVIGNYSSLESANAAKIIVQQQCDCDPVVFEK